MCNFGIDIDSFSPNILYIFKRKFTHNDKSSYHCHDFVSFIYVMSGACAYKVDGVLYSVAKGDLIICNSGVHHERIVPLEEEVLEFHLGFSNFKCDNLQYNHIIPPGTAPVVKLGLYEQEFLKCLSDIFYEQSKNEPGTQLILKSIVMKLIVTVLKAIFEEEHESSGNYINFESYDKSYIVSSIISFIDENYMNDISLNKLSQNTYLSAAYVSKLFKEETGETPINYLIKKLLSKAHEMLKQGLLPVKEIAKLVGYEDAYHFSKLFKKYYGISPSKVSER